MKILVCLKQVPDGNSRLAPRGASIDEDGLAFVTNEAGSTLVIQYNTREGTDVDVSLEVVTNSPETAVIRVCDHGPGVPEPG